GLIHDVGKVPDEETELSHALLGAKLAERYGENPAIVNAIGAHHDEMEMQYVISPIVQACDAISGARPGARREIMQQYLQRIKDLENLALAYQGVEKAYAIQAGRELRVIVEAEKVTDADSDRLSFEIAQKIQNFKGDVIKRQGTGATATFTVRKISDGIGVERLFPFFSPNIESIVLNKAGRIRRAKLFYQRKRSGKSARIKEKRQAVEGVVTE